MRYWWIAPAQRIEAIARHARNADGRIIERKPVDDEACLDHRGDEFAIPSFDEAGFIPGCMRMAVQIDAPYAVFFSEIEDALEHLSAHQSLLIDLRPGPIEVHERFGPKEALVAIRTHVSTQRFERSAAPGHILDALRAACVMNMPPWVASRLKKGVAAGTRRSRRTMEALSTAQLN